LAGHRYPQGGVARCGVYFQYMAVVYIRENCPYSLAVMHKIEELSAPVMLKSIHENKYAMELMEKGGKYQVPCLVAEDGTVMYESAQIMDYLDEHFRNGKEE
jgi:glutaredoxin 2